MPGLTQWSVSRRKVLGLSAGAIAGAGAFSVFSSFTAAAEDSDEYELILQRYEELMAGPADADTSPPDIEDLLAAMTEKTEDLISKIVEGSDREGVFSDLPLVDIESSSAIQTTALRLSTMAQSWAAPGSPLRHDEELGTMVVEGLETLHKLQYNEDQEEFDGWYNWEIGAPRGILEAATMLRTELPDELRTGITKAVEHFIADPGFVYPPDHEDHKPSTGSNRMFLCQNVAIAGALAENGDRIQLASDTAVEPLQLNQNGAGDGFYHDGSCISHKNIPYTGTYGREMLTSSGYLLAVIAGTQWDLASDDAKPYLQNIARTYFPWITAAQPLQPVCGRAVGNGNLDAAWMMGSILMLAEGAPDDLASEWHGYVKGQLEGASQVNLFELRTLPEALLAQKLLDSDVEPVNESIGPRLFPKMDRVLARGEGWCFSLATASERTRGYETMSGENIKAWHQGSGARYLHLESDQAQYWDWFPTVNPYRRPGTTVDSQSLDDDSNSAPTDYRFVGGSQVGGQRRDDGFYDQARYAAWVQQLSSRESTMTAKLSWFFLGDMIVCLGADIQGGSGEPIETILENRVLTGQDEEPPVAINGEPVPESESPGWEAEEELRSFTLPGTGSVVILGDSVVVNLLHEERTGKWSDISAKGNDVEHTKQFITAWLDHGSSPEGASFAYLYVPLADADRAVELEDDPEVEVLGNDEVVQAVGSPSRGLTCANFHDVATVETGDLTIAGRAETSVSMLQSSEDNELEIALSAPCQLRTEREFILSHPPEWNITVEHADSTVSVETSEGEVVMQLDGSDVDGRSHHVKLTW